jgi:hypothetical protein
MNAKLLVGALALSMTAASANALLITDDFNGASLDTSLWTVEENANSYSSGGGAAQVGGAYVIHKSNVEGASNIRANLGNVSASDTVRVDAVMLNHYHYGDGRWSPQVAIYFDNEHWVSLRLAYAGGESGFKRQGVAGGTYSDLDGAGPTWATEGWNVIMGVEMTPTEIRFYTSAPNTDWPNETDMDSHVSLNPTMTIARPAGFTGQAYAILGKGFGYRNGVDSPFLNNSGSVTEWTNDAAGDTKISFARLSVVPEPASLGLLMLGGASMLGGRRRSQ